MPIDPSKLNSLKARILGNQNNYANAIMQLHDDLTFLAAHSNQSNLFLEKFNTIFLTTENLISTNVTLPAEINNEAIPAATQQDKVGFSQRLSTGMEEIADNDNEGTKNFKKLYAVVNECMHRCGLVRQLMYHNIGHGVEMSNDPGLLTTFSGLPQFRLLLSLCGLTHDAIFLRSRVDDENASAKILIDALQPLAAKLTANEMKYLDALIRVLIVGGTTPVFTKNEAGEVMMQPLWEIYLEHFPEHNNSELRNILIACQAMSDADVQRSLIPTLLDNFPEVQQEAIEPSPIFKEFIKMHTATLANEARISVASAEKIILTKLGQSMRFLSESKSPASPLADLNATQKKMVSILRTGRGSPFEADDTNETSELIKGEMNFAGFNKRSLKKASCITNFVRPYQFVVESWQTHEAIWNDISKFINDPNIHIAHKRTLVQDLLIIGSTQQGLNPDINALIQKNLRTVALSTGYSSFSWTKKQQTPASPSPVQSNVVMQNPPAKK